METPGPKVQPNECTCKNKGWCKHGYCKPSPLDWFTFKTEMRQEIASLMQVQIDR